MKKAYIIHGWGAHPEDNWFFWLKGELEEQGFQVKVPNMPSTDFPLQKQWLEHMKEIIGPDNQTYLIGHSLGVIAILKYLESINTKIKAAILVAGFSESVGIREIESFTEEPLNYKRVKSNCEEFVVIHSDNDPLVPLEKAKILEKEFNAKLIIMNGAEHIDAPYGEFKLPTALEEILRIANN